MLTSFLNIVSDIFALFLLCTLASYIATNVKLEQEEPEPIDRNPFDDYNFEEDLYL